MWYTVAAVNHAPTMSQKRHAMRFSDGVLDVVGNCNRSVTHRTRFLNHNLFKTFSGFFATRHAALCSRFWEFWTNHLKSRFQLNHVPVHGTHSAKVRKHNDI